MTKLNSLEIQNFRHIESQKVEFGNYITVITGLNGTGKSSILGWIAQLCDFKSKEKTILDTYFKEDYRNVFKFCPTNDYIKEYEVKFNYSLSSSLIEESKQINTRYVNKTEKSPERYRTDFDGRGKALDHPIIYLGLKRLIPLATENKISSFNPSLSSKYINTYSNLIKEIFVLVNDKIRPEPVKSTNKKLLALQTEVYGHLGNSAGQDNISQIISSLISFEILKEKNKDSFNGGIILIDEIDSTLYAASQCRLIDVLFRYARKLDIQIIFTTHSVEILEYLKDKFGNDTKINYFNLLDGKVKNSINPSVEYIRLKIKNEVSKIKVTEKINFICEDEVAQYWIKNLINNTELKKIVNIEKGPFPDGTIISMAESNHSIFKKVYFILDGDVKKKLNSKKIPPRTVFLPTEFRPETVMYDFVKNLSDYDDFWDDENNFTKLTCFNNFTNDGKGVHKSWFLSTINKKEFGNGYSKLFNRWKKDNQESVNDFLDSIRKVM
ncbi:AAA family ATPase [Flavobacterium sp. GA093]|uniref:AAA family ATPase n=1 Tax=Flavobacterium hydrocarbonoxydans TaxID=2683249 RepID=A0A6I4NL30_9FLAO|nr:AAA family ATPase [Flavobacterium hydrocarbonoxydans]MWB94841.1 AAA family ATPase [Flavobacterium hydrocarbonoxydans]